MDQFLAATESTGRKVVMPAGWTRWALVIGIMTLLVLGMNPDGGRHIRVSSLESNVKLVLAVSLGMVTAGRFMAPRTRQAIKA